MMSKLRWPLGACGCLILILCLSSSAAAQVTEVDFKALYAAAEYDKALEVVGLARQHSRRSSTRRSVCSRSDVRPMRTRRSKRW